MQGIYTYIPETDHALKEYSVLLLLLLLLLLTSLVPPLCGVFTVIYLKQTMFLGY
jgi:hypothetical protein